MKLQQRWAVAVLAAMAIFVSNAGAEIRSGKASLGASVGMPFLMGDAELKEGQSPRLMGLANFQYVFTPSWRLSTTFGYGWVGYKDGTPSPYPLYDPDTGDSVTVRDDMLTKLVPVNATIIRALTPQGKGWSPYVGAGAGLTRLEIVNKRLKVKDPATFDPQATWSPNVHALAGVEYVLPSNTNITFDWNARWTQLMKSNDESFPSGFTGKHSYLNIAFGVNVYFWPIGYKPVETATAPAADSLLTPPAAPAPTEPAPTPTPETPSTPDTSGTSGLPTPAPKSAPPSLTSAPITEIDLGLPDDSTECRTSDLRPMLGVPPRPHAAEGRRE